MNFNKRRVKALTAAILVFAMLIGNCFAAMAETVTINGREWTTDSHGIMAYYEYGNSLAVRGKIETNWIQTTCGDGSFKLLTYPATEDVELELIPSFNAAGDRIVLKYKVTNVGTEAKTFVPVIRADTMVNGNDASANSVNATHTLLTMSSGGAVFTLAAKSYGFYVKPVYFYGGYSAVGRGSDPRDEVAVPESATNDDSAFVAYWREITLKPGKSKVFRITTGVGTDIEETFVPVKGITASEEYLVNNELKSEYTVGDVFDIDAFFATPSDATNQDIEWDEETLPEVDEENRLTTAGTYNITGVIPDGKAEEGEDRDFPVAFTINVKSNVATPSNAVESVTTKPNFTGAWDNPVTDGTWTQEADGSWHYKTNGPFKNTWGYIRNPYAKEGQAVDSWFYFDANGKMVTGWKMINGSWFYFNETSDGTLGAMRQGWITWNGGQYYLTETRDSNGGKMYANTTTPDGRVVDESGKRIK